jgi:hypothetical protein
MQLGGNLQTTFPDPRERHPHFHDLGDFKVARYHNLWNLLGPQYAGHPPFVVPGLPHTVEKGEPFAVFMQSLTKRAVDNMGLDRLIGWEYCGQYAWTEEDDIDSMWTAASAHCCTRGEKAHCK